MLFTRHTCTQTDVILSLKWLHKPLQNTMWTDRDLEATFTNDRNLKDVAVDDSACPKEFVDCIPSRSLGRLNCKPSSHGYMHQV